MDRFEFSGRSAGIRVSLVMLDFVGNFELFQKPDDTLRARIIQMVHSNHRDVVTVKVNLGKHLFRAVVIFKLNRLYFAL